MDDQSELKQDYEITIESMRREIILLTDKLNAPLDQGDKQAEYAKCEELLKSCKEDIEGHTADVIEESRKHRELLAEEEWVKNSSPW